MVRQLVFALIAAAVLTMTAGCLPSQTIVVRFEDLKTDFMALESGLDKGEWYKFDIKTMTVTIS